MRKIVNINLFIENKTFMYCRQKFLMLKITKSLILLLYISIAFFFLITTSCIDEINDQILDKDYSIVINCLFNPDSSFTAYLSKSYNPYGKGDYYETDDILNAQVSIYENNQYIGELFHTQNGIYKNPKLFAKINKYYRIEVIIDNKKAWAESYIPEKASINSITIDTTYYNYWGGEISCNTQYKLNFNDPDGPNYYLLTLYTNNIDTTFEVNDTNKIAYIETSSFPVYFSSNDPVIGSFDSHNKDVGEIFFAFSDKFFNGSSYNLDFIIDNSNTLHVHRVSELDIYVQLNMLSFDFAKYIFSYMEHIKAKDNHFAEPIPIYNNIKGGLGIFAGYNYSLDTIKIYKCKKDN